MLLALQQQKKGAQALAEKKQSKNRHLPEMELASVCCREMM